MASARRAGARLFSSVASRSASPSHTTSVFSSASKNSVRQRYTTTNQSQYVYASNSFTTCARQYQQSPPAANATAAGKIQQVQHELSPSSDSTPIRNFSNDGLSDPLPSAPSYAAEVGDGQVDWTRSFHGLSSEPFTPEQAAILMERIDFDDIEIKPDGIVYLPEIKYRRILNRAFGPGGWGLAPRGETIVTGKIVTREYGLVCGGRLVSIARGEQTYFDPDGIPTATEGCKSNAMMRCCKDLGIASELWDPRFIKRFMAEMGKEILVEHETTKRRRKHWMRKDDELKWPLKEIPMPGVRTVAAPAAPAAAAAAAPAARKVTPSVGSASGFRAPSSFKTPAAATASKAAPGSAAATPVVPPASE